MLLLSFLSICGKYTQDSIILISLRRLNRVPITGTVKYNILLIKKKQTTNEKYTDSSLNYYSKKVGIYLHKQ